MPLSVTKNRIVEIIGYFEAQKWHLGDEKGQVCGNKGLQGIYRKRQWKGIGKIYLTLSCLPIIKGYHGKAQLWQG